MGVEVWTLSDGTAGMENQVVGLAQRIGLPYVALRAPRRRLPPGLGPVRLREPFVPPWPRLLIATGRASVDVALAIRKAADGRTFTVQVQDPRVDPARFDLVVAPLHDGLAGPNVIATLGALHGVTAAALAAADPEGVDLPRPRIAVLLGGPNRAYRFRAADAAALGARLAAIAGAAGGSLLVTPSRRTGAAALAAFRTAIAGTPHTVWDGRPPNPYLGLLAAADAVVVTADSVNMTTEAVATGKPVYVAGLPGGSAKFRRFHAAMTERGYTRPLADRLESWTHPPLDETGRVAAEVRRRLGLAVDRHAEPG
jgi:hypothetical protein